VPVLGRVTDLIALNNLLLMSLDDDGEAADISGTATPTRGGSVWAWNGRGWHCLNIPSTSPVLALAWSNGHLSICTGDPGGSTTNTHLTLMMDLQDTQKHPLASGLTFTNQGGALWTGFSSLGLEEIPKLLVSVTVRARNMADNDDLYRLFYVIDDASDYDSNQLFYKAGTTANGSLTESFGSDLGVVCRNVAFKLFLDHSDSPNTRTPVIVSAKLRWMPVPTTLYSRSFGVTTDRVGPTGKSKLEQITDLETIQAVQTMVQVRFGRTPDTTHTGRLVNLGGIRGAANVYDPARWELTHVEII
jgi:hypothetical protein